MSRNPCETTMYGWSRCLREETLFFDNSSAAQCLLKSPVKFILFVYSGTLQTDLLRACKNPIMITLEILRGVIFFGHVVRIWYESNVFHPVQVLSNLSSIDKHALIRTITPFPTSSFSSYSQSLDKPLYY